MKNWSVDIKKLKKNLPRGKAGKEKFAIWKLEQMVNFGLGGKKIKKNQLQKYWNVINIDSAKRKFLSLFVK